MAERVRAALYARVSTEEQAVEGFSITAQLQKMHDYCEIYEYEIAAEYVDDGYTGRNKRRPAYQRMFSDDERSKWDVVIVMKMDRIHRNSRNFLEMMDDLSRHHQDFISTTDRIDTKTAIGRFTMNMMQNMAQLESEQIGERTYMGMKEKAVSGGGILGFNPPYGYTLVDNQLVPVEGEFETVAEIFSLYIDGYKVDEIAYKLNSSKISTRKGNPWNKFNLRTILHNPVYAGYLRWDGILQKHDSPTPVTVDRYNTVQIMMAERVRDPAKRHADLIDV